MTRVPRPQPGIRARQEAAERCVITQAGVGLHADAIARSQDYAVARLASEADTPETHAFASAYSMTESALVAGLRDLSRPSRAWNPASRTRSLGPPRATGTQASTGFTPAPAPIAAAFDLSYRDLAAAQQRLFRRLGLIHGPGFDAHVAAALDGTRLEPVNSVSMPKRPARRTKFQLAFLARRQGTTDQQVPVGVAGAPGRGAYRESDGGRPGVRGWSERACL